MHVELVGNPKIQCRYIITKDVPQSIRDLRLMKGDRDVLNAKIKANIVCWANSMRRDGTATWLYVKEEWIEMNGTDSFPE